MTIASEISRLQNDKEAMRQAIIEKWVDVAASVSFDDYAACINAIKSGSAHWLNVLVVWWGGGGNYQSWWWGWAVVCRTFLWKCSSINVYIWCWGNTYCNWGTSCICNAEIRITAGGWFAWRYGAGIVLCWWSSWSWYAWWLNWSGNCWWCAWWWWGWAWWPGCPGSWTSPWWQWWPWLYWYGGWWGWWAGRYWSSGGAWVDWWGDGTAWKNWCDATNYWWWWGWSCMNGNFWWKWCQGMVEICYPTDWSYFISCATWWQCCYTCNGFCVHRFTSNWTFCIVS